MTPSDGLRPLTSLGFARRAGDVAQGQCGPGRIGRATARGLVPGLSLSASFSFSRPSVASTPDAVLSRDLCVGGGHPHMALPLCQTWSGPNPGQIPMQMCHPRDQAPLVNQPFGFSIAQHRRLEPRKCPLLVSKIAHATHKKYPRNRQNHCHLWGWMAGKDAISTSKIKHNDAEQMVFTSHQRLNNIIRHIQTIICLDGKARRLARDRKTVRQHSQSYVLSVQLMIRPHLFF